MTVSSWPSQTDSEFRNVMACLGEDVERRQALCTVDETVKCQLLWKTLEWVPKKCINKEIKLELQYDPESHSWIYTQKNWKQVSKTYLHNHSHSSTIHKSQETKATQMSTSRRMGEEKTQWTMTQSEKGREPLPQAIIWTNPEDMMLREISQLPEDKSYFDSTYVGYLK